MITSGKCVKCGKIVHPVKAPGSRNCTRGWSWVLPLTEGLCDECWKIAFADHITNHTPIEDAISKLKGGAQ